MLNPVDRFQTIASPLISNRQWRVGRLILTVDQSSFHHFCPSLPLQVDPPHRSCLCPLNLIQKALLFKLPRELSPPLDFLLYFSQLVLLKEPIQLRRREVGCGRFDEGMEMVDQGHDGWGENRITTRDVTGRRRYRRKRRQ